jgi:hypothetical protein
MYHPYRDGYSVLPALKKLREPPFCVDDDLDRYLSEKRQANQTQRVFFEHEMDAEIYDAFASFVEQEGPPHLTPPYTLPSVAMQVQEDIAVHRIKDGHDWLAAAHVCFPSDWRPEEKIGKPLREIHAPVPGMNANASYKLAETMVHHGPFMRFVWSVIHEDRINFHPDQPRRSFDPANPIVFVKVERQITWGFPAWGAALFLLRQFIIPPPKVDLPALAAACVNMNEAQRRYKGIGDELITWLQRSVPPA